MGKVALVNNSDFKWLNAYKWSAKKTSSSNLFYAFTAAPNTHQTKKFLMHRLILGLQPGDGVECDHVNGNGLDNRRRNLRTATRSQQRTNSMKGPNRTSRFKGVCWASRRDKWQAQICLNHHNTFLGRFDCEEDAAIAYNAAAKQMFGTFAKTNKL